MSRDRRVVACFSSNVAKPGGYSEDFIDETYASRPDRAFAPATVYLDVGACTETERSGDEIFDLGA